MVKVTFEPSTDDHADQIAANVRDVDAAEIFATTGGEVIDSLVDGIDASDWALTAFVDGEPACIFGVVTHPKDETLGIPWLLGTDLVTNHAKELLRFTPAFINQMLEGRAAITNMVHAANAPAMRFLNHIGFDISEPMEWGAFNEDFCQFSLRNFDNV